MCNEEHTYATSLPACLEKRRGRRKGRGVHSKRTQERGRDGTARRDTEKSIAIIASKNSQKGNTGSRKSTSYRRATCTVQWLIPFFLFLIQKDSRNPASNHAKTHVPPSFHPSPSNAYKTDVSWRRKTLLSHRILWYKLNRCCCYYKRLQRELVKT